MDLKVVLVDAAPVAVTYLGSVPPGTWERAVRCAERVARRVNLPGGVLVFVFPHAGQGATVMHWDERVVPRRIRELAAREGAHYVIVASTALFEWEPELAEAALAHEFGHIVLGHCNRRALWFVTLFRGFCAV
ncbi:MAG: hypothetical protein AB1816_15330, partial [Bacillota bacterium]